LRLDRHKPTRDAAGNATEYGFKIAYAVNAVGMAVIIVAHILQPTVSLPFGLCAREERSKPSLKGQHSGARR
jgi:hypothetical protein